MTQFKSYFDCCTATVEVRLELCHPLRSSRMMSKIIVMGRMPNKAAAVIMLPRLATITTLTETRVLARASQSAS